MHAKFPVCTTAAIRAYRRDRAPASPVRDLILSAISSVSRRADGPKALNVSMATARNWARPFRAAYLDEYMLLLRLFI